MLLKRLSLRHYRNLADHTFYFSPFLTLVVGHNSVGKTNLLEAIYLLLSGHGIKEDKQEELISIGQNTTSIEGQCTDGDDLITAKIVLEKNESLVKRYFINKLEKRYFEFSRYLPHVVLFTPQLIESLTTEPSRRRTLFDRIISAVDIEYKKRLTNYGSALTKRNKLLERPIPRDKLISELGFWNTYLVDQAIYIQKKRKDLETFFNERKVIGNFSFTLTYVENSINVEKLEKTLDQQLVRRTTHIGPQRDDYEIFLKKESNTNTALNVERYGSRSQQRLALLWIILNQLQLFKETLNQRPILLLDDIFSELDDINSHLVIDLITKHQTIITTNDLEITKTIDQQHALITL